MSDLLNRFVVQDDRFVCSQEKAPHGETLLVTSGSCFTSLAYKVAVMNRKRHMGDVLCISFINYKL